jgi:hypothetical protein
MVIILSTKNELFTQIFYCLPFLILLGNIGFLMYLNITNQSSIITNLVPVNYYSFTNLTIVLILIQLFFIYKETKSPQFMVTGKISRLTTSYIYLVELITVMCSLVLYVLLTYFKTDG